MPRKPLNRVRADAQRVQERLENLLDNPTAYDFRYLADAISEAAQVADAINAQYPGLVDVSQVDTSAIMANFAYAVQQLEEGADDLESDETSSSSDTDSSASSSSGA